MTAFWTTLKCFSDVEQMKNHWILELEGIWVIQSSSLLRGESLKVSCVKWVTDLPKVTEFVLEAA